MNINVIFTHQKARVNSYRYQFSISNYSLDKYDKCGHQVSKTNNKIDIEREREREVYEWMKNSS